MPMSNARPLILLALLTVAATIPNVNAAATPGITNPSTSSPTNLYFHVGTNQDFPINTQMPAVDYKADNGIGLATTSLSCLPQTDQTKGQTDKRWTTYYGWSSPGYVEYNITENGGPRIHPERGLSFDVNLDPNVQPYIYWYITTFTGARGENSVDPVIPNVVARATIRGGEKITLNDEGYNSGPVIAQGSTKPVTLAGAATPLVNPSFDANEVIVEPGTPPGDATVYGFKIPLKYEMHTIPKDLGYSVRIDLFIQPGTAGCEDPQKGYIMPNFVNTRTDRDHRPRIELAVLNAVRIEYMHPQFVGDDMVIHTSENSPWGNYDVDETSGGIELTITGPNGPVNGVYRAAVVQRYHEHDHHTQAVDVTFVWPYKSLNAADGNYEIGLKVTNDQRTSSASGVALFQIGKDLKVTKCGNLGLNDKADSNQKCIDELQDTNGNALTGPVKSSPNLELVGLLGVIGVATVLVRRKA
ncbi:MAG TPA: hypothetical protein VM286_04210 [Candidatus Thermoplasmatota archaeon]|nr:hypothetical protein [Candidatus Thermoplasmatota archaeon]